MSAIDPGASPIQWLIFDYGEVISRRSLAFPQLAALMGAELPAFRDAYRKERDAYVLGSSDADYWQAVGTRLGRPVSDDLIRELTALDIRGWLDMDRAAVELTQDLHDAGVPLALLSNLPSSLARAVERQPWTRSFRHLLFSADIGVAKPDAGSWRTLLHRLGAEPDACLMLDDRQYNVDAARAAGLHAERWSGADAARRVLGDLGLLPSQGVQR
jgi:putative hydrolase of the HAD superfamily